MSTIIDRSEAPTHLFNITELDLSADLFAERLSKPSFRLGAWTVATRRDQRGVEDVVSQQSFLLAPDYFARIADDLKSIGNVLMGMGKPGRSTFCEDDGKKAYKYTPFHKFEAPFGTLSAEPIVFVRHTMPGARLFINPDLYLFFELEEKVPGSGIWWDPGRGAEAIVQRVIDQGNLEVVDIRVDYLLRYLQARQMSLVIAHYHHLYFTDPPDEAIARFVKGNVVLGSGEQGVKALLSGWKFRQESRDSAMVLCRRLDLWLEIRPSKIDLKDPWAEEPPFDPYTFTLPTSKGPVAPARWRHFRQTEGRTFEGELCDFRDGVCFRQEVLTKYEGASGFDVGDDGSVSCRHHWGLVRGTERIGNELLRTAIGDFAEGVPFEEWAHWKQYAVEPHSGESVKAIRQEKRIAEVVNCLANALGKLNDAYAAMAYWLGMTGADFLWRGSLDSIAGRQLKWVYPASAGDDEFIKRATLISTFVIEELEPPTIRKLLSKIGGGLDLTDEEPPRPLGSRKLLQRLTLISVLIRDFRADIGAIPILVREAEGKTENMDEPDLKAELEKSYRCIRDDFAPLAFLYDLRNVGGLAHKQDKERTAEAASRLNLPAKDWHRLDYLRLLELITESIEKIALHLETAA